MTTEKTFSPYNIFLTLGIIALLFLGYAARSRAAFIRVSVVMLTETALYGLIKLVTWKVFHLFPRPSHGDGGFPSGPYRRRLRPRLSADGAMAQSRAALVRAGRVRGLVPLGRRRALSVPSGRRGDSGLDSRGLCYLLSFPIRRQSA